VTVTTGDLLAWSGCRSGMPLRALQAPGCLTEIDLPCAHSTQSERPSLKKAQRVSMDISHDLEKAREGPCLDAFPSMTPVRPSGPSPAPTAPTGHHGGICTRSHTPGWPGNFNPERHLSKDVAWYPLPQIASTPNNKGFSTCCLCHPCPGAPPPPRVLRVMVTGARLGRTAT
jgi:hypothetical protein